MHFTAVSLMSSNSMTDKGEKRFFSSVELEELKEETKAKSSFPQRGTLEPCRKYSEYIWASDVCYYRRRRQTKVKPDANKGCIVHKLQVVTF